jgi:general secretion pathway protein C
MAIIAKDSKQLTLFAGDSLPGYSAKIMSILSDRIVISYQGAMNRYCLMNNRRPEEASINHQ